MEWRSFLGRLSLIQPWRLVYSRKTREIWDSTMRLWDAPLSSRLTTSKRWVRKKCHFYFIIHLSSPADSPPVSWFLTYWFRQGHCWTTAGVCREAVLYSRWYIHMEGSGFVLWNLSMSFLQFFSFKCSCCVDEVAAEHALADCIIHFGPSCLTQWDNMS